MQNALKMKQQRCCSQFELTSELITKLNTFKITPTAKLVLLYLTTCYNPKHKEVFPKQKTIADKLGISERSVTRAIQELFNEGLILIECKYTNRYKFTSRIAEKYPENLSNDLRQIVSQEPDNLSVPYIEQKKETKKEQTLKSGENVYKGDDLILYEYAKTRAKYSVDAFIQKIKENGGADKIICEYKKKKNYTQMNLRRFDYTQKLGEIYKGFKEDRVMPEECATWVKFGEKIKARKYMERIPS